MQEESRAHVNQTISNEDRSFGYATGNIKPLDGDDEHIYLKENSKNKLESENEVLDYSKNTSIDDAKILKEEKDRKKTAFDDSKPTNN